MSRGEVFGPPTQSQKTHFILQMNLEYQLGTLRKSKVLHLRILIVLMMPNHLVKLVLLERQQLEEKIRQLVRIDLVEIQKA
jgi:hypothetical protein